MSHDLLWLRWWPAADIHQPSMPTGDFGEVTWPNLYYCILFLTKNWLCYSSNGCMKRHYLFMVTIHSNFESKGDLKSSGFLFHLSSTPDEGSALFLIDSTVILNFFPIEWTYTAMWNISHEDNYMYIRSCTILLG